MRFSCGILRYSIILNSACPENSTDFKQCSVWEIAGWLVDKYPRFQDEFNNPSGWRLAKPNKIQSIFDGVEGKVKKLTYLELMEQGKVHVGSNAITSYRFTELGYLLAWIIESFNIKQREITNNQIYKVLQRNSSYNQSSYDVLGSLEYRKYKERGMFDELFTSILRDIISHSNRQINTMRDLITGSPLPNFNNENNAKVYLEIWHEAFNELPDEETRNCCLYWLKLRIEQIMETKPPKNIKAFEERRFDLRSNYDTLALEGICSNCHLPSALSINILEYMNRISFSSEKIIVTKRTVCDQNSSIELPML